MKSRDAVFKTHLNRLSSEPSIKIALFGFAPYRNAQSFRFQSDSDYADAWSILEAEVAAIQKEGKSEVKDEGVLFKDEPHRLVVARSGASKQSSYFVALVAEKDPIGVQVPKLLSRVARKCTSESYSMKWK